MNVWNKKNLVLILLLVIALFQNGYAGMQDSLNASPNIKQDMPEDFHYNTSVVAYPPVGGEKLSAEYVVKVNGKKVPVYTARVDKLYRNSPLIVDETYSFAGFDCSGPVDVIVESALPLTELSIRTVGLRVASKLDGHRAKFTLDRHGTYLIERNGNGRKDLLLLTANPPMENPPREGDPGVVYFGPGRHDAGLIELTDDQTLYIDGGAVVTGRIEARGDNIRICGRGVLENSDDAYYGKTMILLEDCRDAVVEGLVLRKNSQHWTLVAKRCDGVMVSNVKICGTFFGNDDGIDPVNTRNMTIKNCFIRTKDDCLAFKGMDDARSNCENITVSNTMMWSDQCCTILLGDESRAAFMRNITIRDCFVPYLSYEGYPKKFLMLHSGEDMRLEQIRIENIEIGGDGQDRNFIEMTCEYNQYSKSQTAGYIRDIVLKNVKLTGAEGGYYIVLKGFDEMHKVRDVRFEDCSINGKPLTAESSNLKIGKFTKNISFHSSPEYPNTNKPVIGSLNDKQFLQDASKLILSSPLDYQVFQRTAQNRASVPVTGRITGNATGVKSLEISLSGNGEHGQWRPVEANWENDTFSAQLEIPAGGWYQLKVRVSGKDPEPLGEAVVNHFGVGEVFVVAGQSNSANYGEVRQSTKSGRVASFDGKLWGPANDPQPGAGGTGGSFMPPFGDGIVEYFNVPVGFVAFGHGGTSIREWLPEGSTFPNPPTVERNVRKTGAGMWESKGEIYRNFMARIKQFDPNGFRAVLWHQGESDANQEDPGRTLAGNLYREYLARLITLSHQEIGWKAPWFVAQTSYHVPGNEADPEIRAAQAALWKNGIALQGPDTDQLKGMLRERKGMGVHFSGPGLQAHAKSWLEKVVPWLEAQLRLSADSSHEKRAR